ncbi:magnesium transporter MRS2-4 isoform X2 [Beta vulgaris subsp. vulgaris]|uniref:magnesium transporter MRS2-4 isoform X2 n=1 Tax=Beta vulgaris subsp. vulgaris TaxID=3555 RepID=UPI0020367417|nr:magnesium transporter MRS2-4 isoform X2 [Beta vulgaris subsp. vulgaris]
MGKNPLSFRRTISRRRNNRKVVPPENSAIEIVPTTKNDDVAGTSASKGKKKMGGARLWMKFDKFGQSELIEWDKSAIIKRVGIPARDLRILGPVFSQSSNILDQLRQQLPQKSQGMNKAGHVDDRDSKQHPTEVQWARTPEPVEGEQQELPFEFQVLEIALEVVCSYLDSNVAELEKHAYPVLDDLARNVSTKNLKRVRSLKSNLTRLLARVQKVRDEIEHLLDDNEDMAHLYLTRKLIQYQQSEALLNSAASNSIVATPHALHRNSSYRSGSMMTSNYWDDDVEDLEMLLEAYFMQLDGTRNKILSVREYIDDTEDYVNIQLDNQRNELIQLQLNLTIASFAIAIDTLIAGAFGMNIPCSLYKTNGVFGYVVGGGTAFSFLIFILILGYARWKKLLGS